MNQRLAAVLDEIDEFLEDQEDVRDGSDGPLPNKAMTLLNELRTARALRSETASLGEAAIRELRGLEQTAIMLEKQAPELYPEVKDGKVHFGRAVMESAAEAIRQAWANVIAAGTKGGTNGS